jgi:putative mRNA 3-end processing factor
MINEISDILYEHFGFFPFRRRWGSKFRPHFSFKYSGITWHVDSSRGRNGEVNLITHAHTDHHGQKNIENPFALASKETATILEVCCGKFVGKTFNVGKSVKVKVGDVRVKVKTYPTHHILGASAFLLGDILITGDIKAYTDLPKCKVLVTEATYGSPEYIFEDEIDKLVNVDEATLGAYPIGKSQRAAQILLNAGREVCVEGRAGEICRKLGIDISDSGDVVLTTPRELKYKTGNRYVLTAQKFYRFPRIVVSDHLDYTGLIETVEHCNPEFVFFYHGKPSEKLIHDVEEMGCHVILLDDLSVS